jgi:hypothetical protein
LPPLSSWDDLGDFLVIVFFNDFFQAEIHILLANHQEDGVDERTGLKLIKGVGEDGFLGQEVELFLHPFHETVALPSGDNDCIGLHHSTAKLHGMMEYSIFSLIPIFQFG